MADKYSLTVQERQALMPILLGKNYTEEDEWRAEFALSKANGDTSTAKIALEALPNKGAESKDFGFRAAETDVTGPPRNRPTTTNYGTRLGDMLKSAGETALDFVPRAGEKYGTPASARPFGGITQNDIANMLADPTKVLHGQKMSREDRKKMNAFYRKTGNKEFVIEDLDDDFAWAEREVMVSSETPYIGPSDGLSFLQKVQGSREADLWNATKAGAYGFVNSGTVGLLHGLNALTRTAGLDSNWWTDAKNTWLSVEEDQYSRSAGMIGNVLGFFAPTKWAGLGIKGTAKGVGYVAGKVAATRGAKVVAEVAGKTAVGRATGAAVAGTAKVVAKAVEVPLNLATRVTSKTIFELPKKLVDKAGTWKVTKAISETSFVKASGKAIDDLGGKVGSGWVHSKIAANPVLAKIWEKNGAHAVQRALSKTITQAWNKSRRTSVKTLIEAGEKDAIDEAEKMFIVNMEKEIRRLYGNKVSNEVVGEMVENALGQFQKHVSSSAGKAGDTFRRMLMNPLGIKGQYAASLGHNILNQATHGAQWSAHRAVMTFNQMLGLSAMTVQAPENDPWYTKGQLYVAGAKDYFLQNAKDESYWRTFASGAFFASHGGLSYIPSNVPFLGKVAGAANPFSSLRKAVFGPKISASKAGEILAKEFGPAHQQLMGNINRMFGRKATDTIARFLSNAPQTNKKLAVSMLKKAFKKDPESLSNSFLGRVAAMMKSERATFRSSKKDFRRGAVDDAIDDLQFDTRHVETLLNTAGKTPAQIRRARELIIGQLKSNMSTVVSNYRKTAMKQFMRDGLYVFGGRVPWTFLSTGGYHMLSETNWGRDADVEEKTEMLSHLGFSLWASSEPVFSEGGIHLTPRGWGRGRKEPDSDYMPGYSDLAIEMNHMERQMFYMGLGTARHKSAPQDLNPKETALTLAKPLGSQRALVKSIGKNISKQMKDGALRGLGIDKTPGMHTAYTVQYPGQAPVAPGQLGPMVNAISHTSTEIEHGKEILFSLLKNTPEMHDLFNIGGLTPADGTEWVKALERDESTRDFILSAAVHAMKTQFISDGIMEPGDELRISHALKATAAEGQKINGQFRKAAVEAINALRLEQMNVKGTDRSSSVVDWFNFRDNDKLNTRIDNQLDIGKLFELNVHGRVLDDLNAPGETLISNEQSYYSASEGMLEEEVSAILDRFDQRVKEMGVDDTLNLSDGTLRNHVLRSLESYGQSTWATMMEEDHPVPLDTRPGVLTKERVFEGFRFGGLLAKDNTTSTYVLKQLPEQVLREMEEPLKTETKSAHYFLKNEPDVFVPSESLYEKSPDWVIKGKSDVRINKPITFGPVTHPKYMNGQQQAPGFQHESGMVGAMADIGLSLSGYHQAQRGIGRLLQYRKSEFSDSDVAAIAAIDDAGFFHYGEKGRRAIPANELIMAVGGRVFTGDEQMAVDIRAHFDAVREAWKDPTATGDINYEIITPKSYLKKIIESIESSRGAPMTNSEISSLENWMEGSSLTAYNNVIERLTKKGFLEGWATSDNTLEGNQEVFNKTGADNEEIMERLSFVLNPLAEATTDLERRELLQQLSKKVLGLKRKAAPKTVIRIDKLHRDIQQLLLKNNPRSIEKLHRMLQGTKALVITQQGGRPSIRMDLERLEGGNIEHIIEKLDLINRGITDSQGMREEFLKRTNEAGADIRSLLPDMAPPNRTNGVMDVMTDVGIGTGSALSAKTLEGLGNITAQLLTLGIPGQELTIDNFRSGYSGILKASIAEIVKDDIPTPSESGATPFRTSAQMKNRVDNLSDLDVYSILFDTSDMREYRIITAGKEIHAESQYSSLPVKDAGQRDEVRASVKEPKFTEGGFSVKTATRKRTIVDDFGDDLDTHVSLLRHFNSETKEDLLTNSSARRRTGDTAWHNGVDAIDPSERGAHMYRLDDNGQIAVNRMLILEKTEDESMFIPVPFTSGETTTYIEWLNGMVGRLDGRVGEDTDQQALVDLGRNLASDLTDWQAEQYNTTLPDHDMYRFITSKDNDYVRGDLTNLYRMGYRERMFGSAQMISHAVKDAGLKGSKRIRQLSSDSVRRLEPTALNMAIQDVLDTWGPDGEEIVRNFSEGTGRNTRYRVLAVNEEELQSMFGVDDLDGAFMPHPILIAAMAKSMGYGPGHNLMKAFVHVPVGDSMLADKGLMGVPLPRVVQLMDRLGVAAIEPRSTVKIGASAIDFVDVEVNGRPRHVHVAAWGTADGSGRTARADRGVYTVGAEDIKFQSMPHPEESGTVLSGQMTLDWHPDAVADFNSMLPVQDIAQLAGAVLGDIQPENLALARALMTDIELNPIIAEGDLLSGKAAMSSQVMAWSTATSPAIFFRRQVQNRLLSIMRETLFKRYSRHGGKGSFMPDATYAKTSGEVDLANYLKNTPVEISGGAMGVKRTMTPVRGKDGVISLNNDGTPRTREWTPADSDDFVSANWPLKINSPGSNHYNVPSNQVEGIPGREIPWNPHRLDQGPTTNAAYGAAEEIWAGGHTGVRTQNTTPFQQIFAPGVITGLSRRGVTNFEVAAEAAGAMYHEIMTNTNVVDMTRSGGLIDQHAESLRAVVPNENHHSIDALAVEVKDFITEFLYNGTPEGGLNSGGIEGSISAGNSQALMTMLTGRRTGDTWDAELDAYDSNERMVDPRTGEELANHDGKTPVTYGQFMFDQRSPSGQPNDTVPSFTLSFLPESMGAQIIINRIDQAGIQQGDNDGDKSNIIFSAPAGMVGEILRIRNIMGGIPSQKTKKMEHGFSYIVPRDSDEYSTSKTNGNQYLRYLADQKIAKAMTGQLVNVRTAASNIISNNIGFEYDVIGGGSVNIEPVARYDEFMEEHMPIMIDLISRVQKVLDVPGEFMEEDLKNMNVDHEIFGRLMRKGTRGKNQTDYVPSIEDPSRQGSKGQLNDIEYHLLGAIRRLISRISSISRDEFVGGESVSKNMDVMIDFAIDVKKISRSDVSVETGLKEFLKEDLEALGYKDEALQHAINTLRIRTNNNVLFSDFIADAIVRVGTMLEGDLIGVETYDSAQGREALLTMTHETDNMRKLRKIRGEYSMRQYISYAERMAAEAGPAGGHWADEAKIQKAKLRTLDAEATAMKLEVQRPKDIRELKRFEVSAMEGAAMLTTLMNTPREMVGNEAAEADAMATELIRARNQLWGAQIGQEGGKYLSSTGIVKGRTREVILNDITRVYFESFLEPDESNFEELLGRLLELERLATYKHKASDYIAFKPMKNDLVEAAYQFSPVRTLQFMTRLMETSIISSTLWRKGTVRNLKELQAMAGDMDTWDAQVGEARSLIRRNMDWSVENPVMDTLDRLALSRPREVTLGIFGDVVASGRGGGQIQPESQLLRDAMQIAADLEMNPKDVIYATLKPNKNVVLDIASLRAFYSRDFDDQGIIEVKKKAFNMGDMGFAKDIELEYRRSEAKAQNEATALKNEGRDKDSQIPFTTPERVKLNPKDIAVINSRALKRLGNVSKIISGVSYRMEQMRIKTDSELPKDYDNGLSAPASRSAKTLRKMSVNTQMKRNRKICGGS